MKSLYQERTLQVRDVKLKYRPVPRGAEQFGLYELIDYCITNPEELKNLTFFDAQYIFLYLWSEAKKGPRVYQDTPDIDIDRRLRFTIPYRIKSPDCFLDNVSYAFNDSQGVLTGNEMTARQKYVIIETIRQISPKPMIILDGKPVIGFDKVQKHLNVNFKL